MTCSELPSFIGLLLVATVIGTVLGDGVVEVRFLRYDNPSGRGANGQCCDGRWGICMPNGCDHMFTVCLDDVSSGDDTTACQYGHTKSDAIRDQNHVVFGSRIDNIANPIVFPIQGTVPRELALKVDVWDKDKVLGVSGGHDHVDLLRKRLEPTEDAVANATTVPYTLHHRTTLKIEVTIHCDSDWYSATCDTHCTPPSDEQHYHCDPTSGAPICDEGWTGEFCGEVHEVCPENFCSNGGNCSSQNGQPTCVCPESFVGEHCNKHTCEDSCAPGVCFWRSRGMMGPRLKYLCLCPPGYQADYHESEGMHCDPLPTTEEPPESGNLAPTTAISGIA